MRNLILLILVSFIGFNLSLAQDSTSVTTGSTTWNLASCIDYAIKNNITINTLRLDSKYSEQNVVAARAAKYPDLTGSVTQGLTHYSSGFVPASGYGVNSSVAIYNGGYINNNIKSAELSLQAANLNIEAANNDITLNITEAYLNILLAKENVGYYQDLVNTTAAIVTQTQQRFDTGMVAKKDLLEIQATLASDKYSLVAAENTVRQNILALKQILQLPTSMSFDVFSKDSVSAVSLVAGLTEAQQLALNTRPEVKSSTVNIAVQQTEVEKAKYSLRPSLSLSGSIGSSYTKNTLDKLYFSQMGDNFYQNLGLTLSIPILDRKVTKTNVEKAKINTEIAKLDLQNTKTNLTQAVEQAYINVQNAQQQYIAANEQLKYSTESFRIANEQLRIGSYNLVDYLQQKNLYVQAMQAFIQAKYASALYTKIYNFYTGVPVTQ